MENIHRKTPVLESLFKNLFGKRLPLVNIGKFLRTALYRTPPVAASDQSSLITGLPFFLLSRHSLNLLSIIKMSIKETQKLLKSYLLFIQREGAYGRQQQDKKKTNQQQHKNASWIKACQHNSDEELKTYLLSF